MLTKERVMKKLLFSLLFLSAVLYLQARDKNIANSNNKICQKCKIVSGKKNKTGNPIKDITTRRYPRSYYKKCEPAEKVSQDDFNY